MSWFVGLLSVLEMTVQTQRSPKHKQLVQIMQICFNPNMFTVAQKSDYIYIIIQQTLL